MTSNRSASTGDVFAGINRRVLLAGVLGITLLGFYLRYRCLGCLGFRWDEDLTSLTVKALLEKGVPELPSGMIYLRFYPYQWIVAGSVKLFGFSEFSMRLPGVVLGTILVPTAYWITGKLFNRQIALIVAACIAFSFWQVEMARSARMYAPFFLVYLVAAYAIFNAHFQNPERVFSPWVLPLALLALSFHQLAYSLAILLVLAIPLRRSMARTTSLLLQAGGIGIAFIAWKSIQQRYFDIPLRAAAAAGSSQPAANDSGPFAAILQQVSLPDLDLLFQVSSAFPVMVLAVLAAVVLAMKFVARDAWSHCYTYRALVVIAIALSVAHQFNLVVVSLVMMVISLRQGLNGMKNPAWYRPAIICITLFLLWLVVVVIISVSMPAEIGLAGQGFRKLLRALLDYPNFRLFWSYVLERPLLTLPLALGTLWGIDKIARDKPDPTALFVVGSFWCILFVNGLLETKFEFFRYNLHVDPFFLILVVVGLLKAPELLSRFDIAGADRLRQYSPRRAYVLSVAAIAVIGVNPGAAALTSVRGYTEAAFPFTFFGLDQYDDFKTPAAFVSEHLEDNDIVLVLDPREYWNYLGSVDFWIWSSNYESQTYQDRGRARDRYLGIPVLHSLNDVKMTIARREGRNAWIMFSRTRLARTPWIEDDLKAYLNNPEQQIAYVGRDRQTVVIRITSKLPDL